MTESPIHTKDCLENCYFCYYLMHYTCYRAVCILTTMICRPCCLISLTYVQYLPCTDLCYHHWLFSVTISLSPQPLCQFPFSTLTPFRFRRAQWLSGRGQGVGGWSLTRGTVLVREQYTYYSLLSIGRTLESIPA